MTTLLVIRLVPEKAVPADDFTKMLDGLTIEAHELSFADPDGQAAAVGSATYIAPGLPPSPAPVLQDVAPQPDPNTRITQHFAVVNLPLVPNHARVMKSVATAVIELPDPAAGGEYGTADVRLVITRNGSDVVHKRRYYNVPVSSQALPGSPNDYPGLEPDVPEDRAASLYLPLPAPNAAGGPTVVVPEDGAAPAYQSLRTAVETVLDAEPGNLDGLADLTLKQARHVAREIVWDQRGAPLVSRRARSTTSTPARTTPTATRSATGTRSRAT